VLLTALLGASALVAAAWIGVLRWRPFRLEIAGRSMVPTLEPGDWAVAVAVSHPRRGDVVVVEQPQRPGFEIVKRISGVPGDLVVDGRTLGPHRYWVEGDDPRWSTDSRRFGPVPRERVKARVLLVYWPPARLLVLRRARS
jgi:signal peptidase I